MTIKQTRVLCAVDLGLCACAAKQGRAT